MKHAVCLIGLLLVSLAPVAQETPLAQETEWMALLLDGHKTGHLKSVRTVWTDRVEHEQTVHIEIKRSGVSITMTTVEGSVETPDGEPLSFFSQQSIGGGEMTVRGEVRDGLVAVTTRSGGSRQVREFPWPEGALLSEGLRLQTEAHGLAPGTSFTARVFLPGSLQATDVVVRIAERERVDLFGVEMDLVRTEQVMDLGQTKTTAVAWVDEDLTAKKMRFSIMGMALETIACPQLCAQSEIEPAEFFTQAFARAPRDLTVAQRAGELVFEIRPRNGALHFPESDEQRVEVLADGAFRVRVRPIHESTPQRPQSTADADAFLTQTRWLQSKHPTIERLARRARGSASEPAEIMQELEGFVRRHVSNKNLSVGYATALETARNRSGDCTEHALLLAALGRASGIPTRVATGLAYVANWLGASNVFVPHAWTQALIDGRWISFDAALSGFDAGHIALSYGDGDPWHFYDSVNTLGNFDVVAVETRAP